MPVHWMELDKIIIRPLLNNYEAVKRFLGVNGFLDRNDNPSLLAYEYKLAKVNLWNYEKLQIFVEKSYSPKKLKLVYETGSAFKSNLARITDKQKRNSKFHITDNRRIQ